ncbi:MAG: hypothetical protein P1P86_04245 [Bacteroidales bacterium]|nr:hypothetical protein [Bacteroidales bacterium]
MIKFGFYKAPKRIPLIILLSGFLSPWLLAQDTDHVYLKSGSVIRGKITEIDPVNHVKIEDLCGNLWYYQISDVEKISSEPFESALRKAQGPVGFDAGFVNMTSIGFLAGSSHNSQAAPFSLLMVNGYLAPNGLFAGIGTGVEFLSTTYVPLYFDARYELPGTELVPYLMAKGGYALPLSSGRSEYDIVYEYSGGPLLGVGLGLKIRTRTHFAWDMELLYRYQETSYKEIYDWNNQEYDYTDIFNRIEIRLGFYID